MNKELRLLLKTSLVAGIMTSIVPAQGTWRDNPPNWPDGYSVVVHLGCGDLEHVDGEAGISLHVEKGQPFIFPGVEGPLGTALLGGKDLMLEAGGLSVAQEYVVALEWFDADNQNRFQSVTLTMSGGISEKVLPTTPAKSFYQDKPSPAVILFPIKATGASPQSARFEIHCESGPNAVLNGAWLLHKKDQTARKSILIVTGDEYPGHLWRETAPAMAAALREDPQLEVSITESPMILGSPLLRHYDAVMIHFKDYPEHFTPGQEARSGLRSYVDNGGGLFISHFGCGAFQEWSQFVQYAGRVWNPSMRAHDPYGSFEVRLTDPLHPVTQGLTAFTTTDEMYTCLDGETPIHVLCEATSVVDRKVYPVAFTLEAEKPRMVHCTLGHDRNALSTPGTRALYRNAARWVTGLTGP